jgi:hypothetical protein
MESQLYDGTKVLKLNKQKTSHQLDHYIQIANKLLENVAVFTYLERLYQIQSAFIRIFKSRLNFGNACYHVVQKSI